MQRVAEAGRSPTGGRHFAVYLHLHARLADVEAAEGGRAAAEDVEAAAGVVGDHVHDGEVPIGGPAVDDLDRRQHVRRGADDVDDAVLPPVEILAEHERDLTLGSRLHEDAGGNVDPVGDAPVGEEGPADGSIDAERLLHHHRGEADLAAADAATGGDGQIGVGLLNGVRGIHIGVAAEQVAHRFALPPRLGGLTKPPSGLRDRRLQHLHSLLVRRARHKVVARARRTAQAPASSDSRSS